MMADECQITVLYSYRLFVGVMVCVPITLIKGFSKGFSCEQNSRKGGEASGQRNCGGAGNFSILYPTGT